MTIPAGCIGGGPPTQWHSPENQAKGTKGGKLEITLSVSLDEKKSSSTSNTRGSEHHFNDDHLYGGDRSNGNKHGLNDEHQWGQGHNCPWGSHGGGQHNAGGGPQPSPGNTGIGNGHNPEFPPSSGAPTNDSGVPSDLDSVNDDIKQRNQEIRQETLESLRLVDQANATSIRMHSIAQSEKMIVDTNNSVLNGYVDSSSKASNASLQSSKSINF